MTTQDLQFRLDMLRYLLRDLAADLVDPAQLSPTVDACHLVARDELRTALQAIQSIYDCLIEAQDEV